MAKWKSAHPGLIHGYQILGNAGTVVCLDTGTSSEMIKAITVVAMDNNSSQILIGSSDLVTSSQVRGFDSGKGLTYDPINIPPVKLNSFYINGGASSDGVDFYAIKA